MCPSISSVALLTNSFQHQCGLDAPTKANSTMAQSPIPTSESHWGKDTPMPPNILSSNHIPQRYADGHNACVHYPQLGHYSNPTIYGKQKSSPEFGQDGAGHGIGPERPSSSSPPTASSSPAAFPPRLSAGSLTVTVDGTKRMTFGFRKRSRDSQEANYQSSTSSTANSTSSTATTNTTRPLAAPIRVMSFTWINGRAVRSSYEVALKTLCPPASMPTPFETSEKEPEMLARKVQENNSDNDEPMNGSPRAHKRARHALKDEAMRLHDRAHDQEGQNRDPREKIDWYIAQWLQNCLADHQQDAPSASLSSSPLPASCPRVAFAALPPRPLADACAAGSFKARTLCRVQSTTDVQRRLRRRRAGWTPGLVVVVGEGVTRRGHQWPQI